MALEQQVQFLAQIPPFNLLESKALNACGLSMDVVYFATDSEVLLGVKEQSYVYFVIKGLVAEYVNDTVIGRYGVRAFFGDQNILLQQGLLTDADTEASLFKVLEEVILYRMPAQVFLEVYHQYDDFRVHFKATMVDKLNALHSSVQLTNSTEVMMDTVCSAPIRTLVTVKYDTSLQEAIQQMVALKTDACVVQFDGVDATHEYGIITSTDILKAIAAGVYASDKRVSELANFPLVTVHQFDYLFNALLKMTRFQIDRLVVRSDDGFIGFLHQKDLMGLFANQSGLVLLKVEQAVSVEDLRQVAQQIEQLVVSLNHKGIKTHYIAKLVNELHRKILFKLVALLLPEPLHSKMCLIVMGSEGRAEQVVRTDQDNALILADFLEDASSQLLDHFAEQFNRALITIGFPACPGNIMVSNPQWRLPLSDFITQVRGWFDQPSLESFMNIAIFCDSEVVAGDARLLQQVQMKLQQRIQENPVFLRHFARAAVQFDTPVSFFGGLRTEKSAGIERIDLKKGGIFPIVHGVRCYALEQHLTQTNTHWRIKALMDKGVFEKSFGLELGEALNFLNTLRLQSMLAQKVLLGASDQQPDNYIDLGALSHLEQDLLKESFRVVEQFKKRLERHFKLHEVL